MELCSIILCCIFDHPYPKTWVWSCNSKSIAMIYSIVPRGLFVKVCHHYTQRLTVLCGFLPQLLPWWHHCSNVLFNLRKRSSSPKFTFETLYFFNGPFPASFPLFSSFLDSNVQINMFQILPMSGFDPRISGVGSDHSAYCATTTAHWDTVLGMNVIINFLMTKYMEPSGINSVL